MNLRVKVYSLLGSLALLGAATYVYKVKPAWLPLSVQAKSTIPSDGKKKDKDPIPVELAVAKRSEISSFLTSTANLRALRDVAVATEAEGVVERVLAEEGDFVKEGQVLFTLDEAQLRIKLELTTEKLAQSKLQMEKAAIKQAKAGTQIDHARIELERNEAAKKDKLISEKDAATFRYRLEELIHDQKVAASETKELQHRVSELEAETEQCKLDIARTQIRAPFAGFVTQRSVNVGQRVRAMDALMNVGSFSPLIAEVHLSERDTRTVKPGQGAAIRLGSDEHLSVTGRVERISPIVDQTSGTVKVTIALDPVPGFRPGSFVRVDIRTDTKRDAILIPKRAVMEEDGVNFVFVAAQDIARKTKVELGYQAEGLVEVRNGVGAGQSVVVSGQGALKEGGKIKVLSVRTDGDKPAAASVSMLRALQG